MLDRIRNLFLATNLQVESKHCGPTRDGRIISAFLTEHLLYLFTRREIHFEDPANPAYFEI